MVAPVLDPGVGSVDVYLPKGQWTHLFTGETLQHGKGKFVTVKAPIGTPAVFYPSHAQVGQQFRSDLIEKGLIQLRP